MNNVTGETSTTVVRNFPLNNNHCYSTSDSLDEIEEAERYNVFLREYFQQQFLRMQAIYPPSFKSKVIPKQKNEKLFKWSFLSMMRNVTKSTQTQTTAFKERKNVSTLSDIIIDSLEKLGIVHFDGGMNGWVCTEE